MIEEFIEAMYTHVPPGAHVLMCQFRGDPDVDGRWGTTPARNPIDPHANVYFTVSAMKKNRQGQLRRRKENFVGGVLLMIDDVGDGLGAKWPLSVLDPLKPSALIETSPGNHQAVYLFDRLVTDLHKYESLIRAFIDRQFLGGDTGMAGVNRVFRPPVGINGKAKYGGAWPVKGRELALDRRYSVEELCKAFDLTLSPTQRRKPHGATRAKGDSIRAFIAVRAALRAAGMIKSEEPKMDGWIDIHCPWTAWHTGAADNGAAIRVPAEDNGWVGAFRCHHGHCEGKGWRELTEWLSEEQEEVLRQINKKARWWEDD